MHVKWSQQTVVTRVKGASSWPKHMSFSSMVSLNEGREVVLQGSGAASGVGERETNTHTRTHSRPKASVDRSVIRVRLETYFP